jgi:hypothetical protein
MLLAVIVFGFESYCHVGHITDDNRMAKVLGVPGTYELVHFSSNRYSQQSAGRTQKDTPRP